eukprot:245046_1
MTTSNSKRLSFDHDLKHTCTSIALRLRTGTKSLDDVLQILRMRIEAEIQFTDSLQNIINTSTKLMSNIQPNESLRSDGLSALYSDFKNEYTQRMAFLDSLKEDVQKPLIAMKEFHKIQTKNNLKALKQQQNEFQKLKTKYNKVIGNDIKNTSKQKQRVYQQQLRKQHQIYDNKMRLTLQNMELNEYKRMNSMRDAFINWSAFTTNYCANRSYDISDLANSMSLINIENDLQIFIKNTITQTENNYKNQNIKQQYTKNHTLLNVLQLHHLNQLKVIIYDIF